MLTFSRVFFPNTYYLKNINDYLNTKYCQLKKILSLPEDQKVTYSVLKNNYREKMKSATSEEAKKEINLAFEYFIDPANLASYDANDLTKMKEFSTFSPNLLVVIGNLEDLKKIFRSKSPTELNETTDPGMRSLLYLACKCGYIEIARFLLTKGADPNQLQINGSTPLHAACFYNHDEIVELLLNAGASYRVKNEFGNLPEDEASQKIIELIDQYKQDRRYLFFVNNLDDLSNIKLVFEGETIVGKRCSINESYNSYWDLAWHGTLLENVPSIMKYGFKKPGEEIDGKEIDIRHDTARIERDKKFRKKDNWASAVFTSMSIFYVSIRAYSETFKDMNGIEWIVVLECRLKKGSYHMSTHTVGEYYFKKNETQDVENRSENSSDVKLAAVWLIQKSFIRGFDDHDMLLAKFKEYIP